MSNYVLRPGLKEEEEKKKVLAREAANLPDVKESNQVVDGFGKINDHKEVAVKFTDEAAKRGDISTIQGKQIKENINNPEKMQRSIENTIGNNKPSLTDSFMESLAFFMPQAIGAGIGALFEGGQGALAGAEIAGGLAKEKREYDLQRERLNQTRTNRRKIDITPDFVDKATGTPLFTQEQADGTVKFVDDTGKVYPSSGVQSLKSVEREAREEGIGERFRARMSEAQLNRLDKNIDKFTSNNKKIIENVRTTEPVIDLLSSNQKVTSEFLAPFIARGVQKEVGNLSETDLKNARVPMPFFKRLKSDFIGTMTGDMSKEERKSTIRLLQFFADKSKSQIKDAAENFSKSRARRLGITQEELASDLLLETGVKYKSQVTSSGKKKIKHGTETTKDGKKYRYNSKTGTFQRVR